MRKLLGYLFIVALTVVSCTSKKGELPEPIVIVNAVSYKTDIKPIMVTYCLGTGNQSCHVSSSNQGAPGDFSNYDGVKAKVALFQSRVFATNGGMPPSYSNSPQVLASADMAKLKKWVEDGAPNN